MMGLFKRVLFAISFIVLFGANYLSAQKVEFEMQSPMVVATNEVFKVEYSSNTKLDRFIAPTFENVDIVAGPTTSTSQVAYTMNGNMVKESRFSYTYVLIARTAGKLPLPAAKAIIDGKEYSTKTTFVEVVEEQQAESQPIGEGGQSRGEGAGGSTKISDDDVLVRMLVNKTNVFKGEPVRATMKLYWRVPLSGIRESKIPAFNGFWKQDLDVRQYSQQRESYNSKVYETQVIGDFLLFPQQSGLLQIEQADFDVQIQIVHRTESRTILDDFFGTGHEIEQIERKIKTSPVSVTVKDWPVGAPAGFNGAVGDFTMNAELSSNTLAANSSATYSVKISGSGNLPLMQSPVVELPSSFEQYNVKMTESLHKTSLGISGYRQFDSPVIARAEGDFTIPPVQFSYFNPKTTLYVTLSSDSQSVVVLPDSTGGSVNMSRGMVSGLSKEDIKVLGQDIRFVKLGDANLKLKGKLFIGSTSYWLVVGALIALFTVAFVYLDRRMKLMKDVNVVRWKRANKVALQRLNAAEEFMKEDNHRNFYEEMLKALWGYMSSKLNIPVATLTKENVREELLKRDIVQDEVAKYIEIISDCEYAQYSPDGSRHMQDIYRTAVESISKFESVIKK